jgi:DNA-binding MarR family transcriptional regulator
MKLDLDRYVPGLLLWVSNRLTSSASQLYRSRFNLGVTDWRLLSYFQIYPWTTAASACELMGLDKAGVSRSVATMVEAGLLESRPAGQRKVEYAPSIEGTMLHDRMVKLAVAREQALLSGFSAREREQLVGYLHRLLGNLDIVRQVGQESEST